LKPANIAGLRGYVTTRNPNFRHYEYELNQKINADAWSRVERSPALLTGEQRTRLDMVRRTRTAIIDEVPTAVFTVMESNRWREDLYLFEAQGEPLTVEMQRLLLELTESQQQALRDDLNIGSERLSSSRLQSLAGGSLAVILGIALALAFWRAISTPVSQLTGVAMRIQRGDLEITAPVESGDELGMFARTFNSMTTQLRQILSQVRKEKQRADDLLNIVIPIGVTLSSERNFDRLLEQMLAEAMSYCGADCGALFLRSDTKLRLVLLRITSQGVILGESSEVPMDLTPLDLADERPESTDSRHPAAHVVRTGATLNLADLDHAPSAFALSNFEVSTGEANYQPLSLLALPLKTTHGEVLGVLQLINAQTPEASQTIPFDTNLQQMMESFSLLAVTALESYAREQRLRQEIRQLRIEIDERKRHEQVNEIVESDFFQDLQLRAQALRSRRRG
ncbi:MAG: HAMP domain-containing protein, partial [Oscillochloris sp.]|nr:HAMP domain-containing protein [Oscillochloris sp.]